MSLYESKKNNLLKNSSSDVVFLTKEWQQIWWDVYGRGKLLLVLAETSDNVIAIAPLFADEGMIFFVGSGCSDYLDFIGDISNPLIFNGMLECAALNTPNFCGFRFYHVLKESKTGECFKEIEKITSWKLYDEGSIGAPFLEIAEHPETAERALQKKSLRRHEAFFLKNGGIEIIEYNSTNAVLNVLERFFEQHINRWAKTAFPSLFLVKRNKLFFESLCKKIEQIDWLRFISVKWKDQIIAFHFGFEYKKNFIWYKPTFDIALAKHSPGEVLLRQLLMRSMKEKHKSFDFGLGEEPFKSRFANKVRFVKTWGLYK